MLVNGIDIPQGRAGANMTGTGWFNLFSAGTRAGGFNSDFTDAQGNPLGDPYGSMAALSVVVPNRINNGSSLPTIQVLLEGLRLATYNADGTFVSEQFTKNPAWILLDILRKCGWDVSEIDLSSFANVASYADQQIQTQDLHGNTITIPRFECNLALVSRRTAADLIRGVRNACRLYLTYGNSGLLQLNVENTFALQQPVKPDWSNSTSSFNSGWPSYEFGDGSSGVSGIARDNKGASTIRVTSRSIVDTPNQFSVEFQDSLNDYQQDSFLMIDVDDVGITGQEITAPISVLGIPNYDQAARILKFNLDRGIRGNTYVQFSTSVKALGLRPGDLITLTYLKEGFDRQPFRVLKIAPDINYRMSAITAQIHDDAWYDDTNGQVPGNSGAQRQLGSEVGLPRPLIGTVTDANGNIQFGVTETATQAADGTPLIEAAVAFSVPNSVSANAPAVPLLSLAADNRRHRRHSQRRDDALLRGEHGCQRRGGKRPFIRGQGDDSGGTEHKHGNANRPKLSGDGDGIPCVSRAESEPTLPDCVQPNLSGAVYGHGAREPDHSAAGFQLRSREFLLASGTATGICGDAALAELGGK